MIGYAYDTSLRSLSKVAQIATLAALTAAAALASALAQTPATPPRATIPRIDPAPSATSNPFAVSGSFRSYYFTRQNASNNPGARFDASSAKYSSTGVNQISLNDAIDLHADYHFARGPWFVGGSYFYANPIAGPCTPAATHAKDQPCVSQRPPNTNPDDTLPGFALGSFPEAYLGFEGYGVSAKIGDQLFTSPWAASYDGSRLKPAAYQGADVSYRIGGSWTLELADMIQFENRTSAAFDRTTLLTSFPAGGGGLASNIYVPGGGGIETNGFLFGKAGYAPKGAAYSVTGYFYGISSLLNVWWLDGKETFDKVPWKPFVAIQGGVERNAGASYIGKIRSSAIGVQIGAEPYRGLALTASFDALPWQVDNVALPRGVTCDNGTFQISAKGATLGYFLPINAGQCFTRANGTTAVYYGGWASPYTAGYSSDPLFTTNISQGLADRHAPGTAWKVSATYTTANQKWVFNAGDAWFDYGNALVSAITNEWDLDAQYHLSAVTTSRYKGLLLRYRYAQRSQSNTFCGAARSTCVTGAAIGASFLGGLPLFKYNRAQLEYDF
ncbi:MAG: hypothetical protein ABI231_08785 [Candidatus Tumulicola sp.]